MVFHRNGRTRTGDHGGSGFTGKDLLEDPGGVNIRVTEERQYQQGAAWQKIKRMSEKRVDALKLNCAST